jgi:hypothetical protein
VSRVMFAVGVPAAMAADTVLFALLRRARPQPFGLSSPAAYPAMLRSAGQRELRRFSSVALSYGRPLTAAGQLIEVETCFAEGDCFLPALEETIIRAEMRDEAWARHDWTAEPDVFGPIPDVHVPAGGFERHDRVVMVAGQERQLGVTRHHRCEALRFTYESMVVTAVARLGFPDRPQFELVTDLEPYLAEHRRFILSWLRFWEA